MSAPANDNFANATLITLPYGAVVNDAEAALEVGEPNPSYDTMEKTVWYKFVPAFTGDVRIENMPHSSDTLMAVYTGASLGTLTEVAADDDYDYIITLAVINGTTYYIQLGAPTWDTDGGDVHITVVQAGAALANDNFANREVLPTLNETRVFDFRDATTETDEPVDNTRVYGLSTGDVLTRTLWYEFTVAVDTLVRIEQISQSSGFLNVYTGATLALLVSQEAIYGNGLFQKVLTPGTYYLQYGTIFDDDYYMSSTLIVSTPSAPANDNFANAEEVTLSSGTNVVHGTTVAATIETDEPSAGTASVWYKFTLTQSAIIVVQNFEASSNIYKGTSLDALTLLAHSGNVNTDVRTYIEGTYYIQVSVDGPDNETEFDLNIYVTLVTAVDTGSASPGTPGTGYDSNLWITGRANIQTHGPWESDTGRIESSEDIENIAFSFYSIDQDLGGATSFGDTNPTTIMRQKFYAPGPWDTVMTYLRKAGAPTDNVTVTVWTDNAGTMGTSLGSTTYNGSVLSTTLAKNFFITPATQQDEGYYWLTYERQGAIDATNYYVIAAFQHEAGYAYPYDLEQAGSIAGSFTSAANDVSSAFIVYGPAICSVGSGFYVQFYNRLWSSTRDGSARGVQNNADDRRWIYSAYASTSDQVSGGGTQSGQDFKDGKTYSFYTSTAGFTSNDLVVIRDTDESIADPITSTFPVTTYNVNALGINRTREKAICVREDGTSVLCFVKTRSSRTIVCLATMSATGTLGSVYDVWSGTTTLTVGANDMRIMSVIRDNSDNVHIFWYNIITLKMYHRVFTASDTFGSFNSSGWGDLISLNRPDFYAQISRQYGLSTYYNDGTNDWIVFPYMALEGSVWKASFWPANSTATTSSFENDISMNCFSTNPRSTDPDVVLAAIDDDLYAFSAIYADEADASINVARYSAGSWSGYKAIKTGMTNYGIFSANYIPSQGKIGVLSNRTHRYINGISQEMTVLEAEFFWFDPVGVVWPATASCVSEPPPPELEPKFVNWIQDKR